MREFRILLIGQPNVGKSSLLNALVGSRVTVSNYPGTTVEVTAAEKIFRERKICFEDTPGIYSISDRSEEEKITEKALFEEKTDGAIIITDASSLERSLYMVLQIMEAGIPSIIALNFIEEAEKKRIKIDCKKLGKLLNVPVIPINPLIKEGINELLDSVLKIKETAECFSVRYDDHIEQAVDKISVQVKGRLPKRFIALRVLEEDKDFYKYLKDRGILKRVKGDLKEHPNVAEDIAITRYGTASFIAEKITQIIPIETRENQGFSGPHRFSKKFSWGEKKLGDKIDDILLHEIWGPLTTTLFFLTLFGILLCLGNLIQGTLMDLTESFLSPFNATDDSVLITLLIQGLSGLTAGISIALPYVFLFYLLLALLEDTGLLSRFIVNTEWFLKKLGLSGKSFIPLTLGLGCTAPAVISTRVLPSKKEQFHTASFLIFVPCSSRIAIIMGVVGFYSGIAMAFSVFLTLLTAGLIWGLATKKIIHLKSEPMLLELPPYRKPLIKNVLAKSWIRMKDFVYIVTPLLALGGMAYGILDMAAFTEVIVKPLSPITSWLGLPSLTIIPLVFGFLQKDLTGPMLLSVLGSEIPQVLTPLQIYTFGVASTLQIPCIIAFGMLWREFGPKKAILLTLASLTYGLLFTGLVWRMIYLIPY